jgi:hypothetical protein
MPTHSGLRRLPQRNRPHGWRDDIAINRRGSRAQPTSALRLPTVRKQSAARRRPPPPGPLPGPRRTLDWIERHGSVVCSGLIAMAVSRPGPRRAPHGERRTSRTHEAPLAPDPYAATIRPPPASMRKPAPTPPYSPHCNSCCARASGSTSATPLPLGASSRPARCSAAATPRIRSLRDNPLVAGAFSPGPRPIAKRRPHTENCKLQTAN